MDWNSEHEIQIRKLSDLATDLQVLQKEFDKADWSKHQPWLHFFRDVESVLHHEGEELLVTLLLELYPVLVDKYAEVMHADEEKWFPIHANMTIGELKSLLTKNFYWVNDIDFSRKEDNEFFWYVSEEKLEPRLGKRHEEQGAELEMPLDTARMISRLTHLLADFDENKTSLIFYWNIRSIGILSAGFV